MKKAATIITTISLPLEVAIRARVLASQQNISRSRLMANLLEKHIRELEQKGEASTNERQKQSTRQAG